MLCFWGALWAPRNEADLFEPCFVSGGHFGPPEIKQTYSNHALFLGGHSGPPKIKQTYSNHALFLGEHSGILKVNCAFEMITAPSKSMVLKAFRVLARSLCEAKGACKTSIQRLKKRSKSMVLKAFPFCAGHFVRLRALAKRRSSG